MTIQKSLKNAMLTGAGLVSWKNNTPTQYKQKQYQYFSPETRTFTNIMARYSSDYVEAEMQGIDPENIYAWQTRMIRMADIVKPTAAIQRHFDDYKMILVADRDIEYITPGSKIVALGSTWLAVNPLNVSGSDGSALIRRCNAVWNFLDYYGNVISEPIIVENSRANANDSDHQESLLISKGYFNVICQYNDYTRQIDTNTRIILGTGAYRVTGYSDFETEYTGDYSSVRLLSFTVRYEEPNLVIDDMNNHVAGGKNFSWDIQIIGPESIQTGQSAALFTASIRNGEVIDCINVVGNTLYAPKTWIVNGNTLNVGEKNYVADNVLYATEHFVSYEWTSDNPSVAEVSTEGVVTALAEGTAIITATLKENPAYSKSITLKVTATQDGVFFTETPIKSLAAYNSTTIKATYFENGQMQNMPLEWSVAGAEKTAYSVEYGADGNSIKVTAYEYSPTPLIITASYQEFSAVTELRLEGF